MAKSGRTRRLAHAWAESAGRVVVGGGALERYGPLLAWGPGAPLFRAGDRRARQAGAVGAPLFDPRAGLPAVAERLRVIGQTVLEDQRNEPLMIRYEEPRGGSSPADRRRALGAAVLLPL